VPSFQEIQNMSVGIWSYTSGVSGTVDTASLVSDNDLDNDEVRVLTITAVAGTDDAAVQVDNRPTAIIPAGHALKLEPNGTIRNPVIYFAGTISYVVEYVTNNFHGSSKGDI
jgi:hypothetical protein